MALDGPIRDDTSHTGFLAGSRALDSLDKLITSTESYFHPSNSGHWTFSVSRNMPVVYTLYLAYTSQLADKLYSTARSRVL